MKSEKEDTSTMGTVSRCQHPQSFVGTRFSPFYSEMTRKCERHKLLTLVRSRRGRRCLRGPRRIGVDSARTVAAMSLILVGCQSRLCGGVSELFFLLHNISVPFSFTRLCRSVSRRLCFINQNS